MRPSRVFAIVTAAAFVFATLGCPTGQQQSCGGGGRNSDGCGSNECVPTVSSAWTDNELGVIVQSPPCPYVLGSKNADEIYAITDTAPAGDVTAGSNADVTVVDSASTTVIGSDLDVAFTPKFADSTTYVAYLATNSYPGQYTIPGNDTLMVNTLNTTAHSMYYGGQPFAYETIHGHINASSQDLVGANGTVEGTPAIWRSEPAWDTTAYTYEWYLDGSQVATTAEYTASLSTGLHTLSNVTIRTDNSRDSVALSVEAYDAAINGPTSVQPFATCTWYGSASNGSSPYSYNWTTPVSYSGQYFSYQNGSNDGEAFYLTLDVTDAAGYEIPLTETIHVSNNAPICPDFITRGAHASAARR